MDWELHSIQVNKESNCIVDAGFDAAQSRCCGSLLQMIFCLYTLICDVLLNDALSMVFCLKAVLNEQLQNGVLL